MVTLSRLGNDTIVTMPIKTLRVINTQLEKARVVKAKSKVLNRKLVSSRYILVVKESVILEQYEELATKDSLLNRQKIKIRQQEWEWLRVENRYEREKKRADKFKRFFIGSLILSVGAITLISLQ